MLSLPRRFAWHRKQAAPHASAQGEEYEIEKAEREAQMQRDRFAESLLEKAGHSHFPFVKDPLE